MRDAGSTPARTARRALAKWPAWLRPNLCRNAGDKEGAQRSTTSEEEKQKLTKLATSERSAN